MPITKVDVQGVTVTVDGDAVGCLQSIGNIEESRSVQEYSCMTSNDTTKALGSITRGAISLGLLLDPNATTDGQKTLRDAFASNTEVAIVIELNNQITPTTGNGTKYAFNAKVSKVSIGLPKDGAVTLDMDVEMTSAITETAAA